MPPPNELPLIEEPNDATLVAACLGGSRDAYGRIVARYQRLLCSLAYSAIGRVSESEDIAQEAFIEGWRNLRSLREPAKLRPWLCGILRHKIGRSRRAERREPSLGARTLDEITEFEGPQESIEGQTMRNEEQQLLWQALEAVPPLYREPLILYYREHQSIEHVAHDLDLSEDAVKQRLSRGRKLLQTKVMSFVEGALSRSTPGRVFTLGVLAALPALTTPAKAAAVGAVAANSATLAKSTFLAAVMASLSGFISSLMALRACLDQSRTNKERRAAVIATLACVLGSVGCLFVLLGLREGALRWSEHHVGFAIACQVLVIAFVVIWPFAMYRLMRYSRELRSSERIAHPECFLDERDQIGSEAGQLRTRAKLFGIPLVHFRFASAEVGDPPVVAWIAGGDRAYGLLFAWGGIAVAPICAGAFSVGLLSVGGVSLGVLSLGTFAVGLVALGAVSIGLKAFAWLSALGWQSAQSGGFSIARIAAEGPIALAEHANSPMARELLADPAAERNFMVLFMIIVVLTLAPVTYYSSEMRRRLGKK